MDIVSIPAEVPPGAYRLKLVMLKPEDTGPPIQLALAGRDAAGRYDLAEIRVVKVTAQLPATIYEEAFAANTAGWGATEGMTATWDEAGREGKGCLHVSGLQPGTAWNYCHFTLRQPVLPSSRYRLSCWMKVDRLDPAKHPPYLKIGITDAAGKWLGNFLTNKYDVTKLGTWQRLVGIVETTPETAGGHLAVEKGGLEWKVSITFQLDDVKLELLEAP